MQYTERQLQKIESNIWKYFFVILSNKRIFAAIFAVYLISMNSIEEKQVGFMMLIANVMSFLFEIPSGYMSDKMGHKNTLIFSRLLLVLSSIGYIIFSNFTGLLIATLLWTIGISFFSGSGSAFMHDTLKALKKDNEYSSIVGKINSYSFFVSMLLSASVPFLMQYDSKIPFYISLLVTFIGLVFSISLRRIKETKEEKEEIKIANIKDVFKESLSTCFMPYGMYFSFLFGCAFAILIYRDPYQLFTGSNLALFGVYFALGRVFTILISRYTGYLHQKIKTINNLVLYSFLIYSILFLLLAYLDNKILVITAFILLDGLLVGSFALQDGFLLKIIENSKFKATHLSIVSQFRAMFEGIFTAVLGFVITTYSYSVSFKVFAAIFIIVSVIMYLNILRLSHKKALH